MKSILRILTSAPWIAFYIGVLMLFANVAFLPSNPITIALGVVSGVLIVAPIWMVKQYVECRQRDIDYTVESVFEHLNR